MNKLYNMLKYIFEDSIYKKIDEKVIESYLNNKMKKVYFNKGKEFVRSNDQAKSSYIIYQGKYVENNYSMEGVKSLLANRTSPQIVGVVPLVNKDSNYETNMIATEDIKAIEIENNYFYNEIEKNGKLAIFLIRNLAGKVVIASKKIKQKRFYNAKENLIIYLYENLNKSNSKKTCYNMKVTYVNIADEIGITERTLYRVLKELKEEKLVSIIDGEIYINDINKIHDKYDYILEEI